MGIVNATIAGGTRRMLQDILAWNHARSTDLQRVNAMAASGLIPKDANGNLQIPTDVLDGLWRPFPGSPPSMTSITAAGGDGSGNGSGSSNQQQPPTTPPAAPPSPAGPAPTAPPKASGLPGWLKVAAGIAALVGTSGGTAGILSWLGSNGNGNQQPPVVVQPTSPARPIGPAKPPGYEVSTTQYELRFGKLKQPANSGGQK